MPVIIINREVAGSSPVAPTFPTNSTMGDRSIGRTPGFEPGNGGSNPSHPTTAVRRTSPSHEDVAQFGRALSNLDSQILDRPMRVNRIKRAGGCWLSDLVVAGSNPAVLTIFPTENTPL